MKNLVHIFAEVVLHTEWLGINKVKSGWLNRVLNSAIVYFRPTRAY